MSSTLTGDKRAMLAELAGFPLAEAAVDLGILTLDLAAIASLNTSHCSSLSSFSGPNGRDSHVTVM